MKRAIEALVLLLTFALPVSAGVTYRFSSVTDGRGGGEMSGSVAVEGANMRLDFIKGDKLVFKDGAAVISTDGGSTMLILDDRKKSYYELNLEELFQTFGGAMKSMGAMVPFKIDNQSVKLRRAGDGGTMEGFPTKRYVVDSSYDMTISVMGMVSSSKVRAVTETWATEALDSSLVTFVQLKGLRTGIEDFDKLMEAQTRAVRGFPLKQVTTTTTTSGKRSQTNTTTVSITNIRRVGIPSSKFVVPAGYRQQASPFAALQKR